MSETQLIFLYMLGGFSIVLVVFVLVGLVYLIKDRVIPAFRDWRIRRLFKSFRVGSKVHWSVGKGHDGVVTRHEDEYLRIDFKGWMGIEYIRYSQLDRLSLIKLSPFEQRVQDYIDKELAH